MKKNTWYIKQSKWLTEVVSELFDGLPLKAYWAVWNDIHTNYTRQDIQGMFRNVERERFGISVYIKTVSGNEIFLAAFDVMGNLCNKFKTEKARDVYEVMPEWQYKKNVILFK
jgi:hypothetical protein